MDHSLLCALRNLVRSGARGSQNAGGDGFERSRRCGASEKNGNFLVLFSEKEQSASF
jgi:hypothetical protein